MRVHRVFVPHLAAGERVLTGREAQHLAQVLRVRPGARVRAFDGAGLEADGTVREVTGLRVTLELGAPYAREVEAALRVTLAVALLKGDKLAEVVRRATELGAVGFRPFVSRRCDVRELSANKLARLRRVAQEAAKQSGRSVVPPVAEAAPLAHLSLPAPTLVAHPSAPRTLGETLAALTPPPTALTVLTGPEGGLTEDELAALTERGAHPIRLGARILRAETAPVALTAALLIPEGL
ncbi:16S rRNA (uracil(1498)-N(3))-methyltransferase [Truepera radiovictrix]|uniref:Ribosomal RNA small subunit methyltransferase E n=1 Tax=Truepera radiovictrix (strain DSM 17093 / CIP 108686 / LMG 22925 / RQ-24) TaxID=649638 RepID=D7CWV5_TRURR|nr:16S rRNA (uracil(1498)-N(3))-methyltransferase [Truepera radiovictrix]ADI14463.1 protein of unknown function DUF558 [Truepera radiovictrix DSM 17093]WMT56982.1 16S rRNA (uracil(1498)-N(3))-methyltransferase [Truepera radiovictrix]